MGGRHSAPNNTDESAADSPTSVTLPLDRPSARATLSLPRPAVDGAQAAAGPSTSRSTGTSTPGAVGRGAAKPTRQHGSSSSASAAHRRLVLDVLAASGVGARTGGTGTYLTPSSNDSTPEDSPLNRTLLTSSSFPLHIFALRDIKCPVCHKMIPADDVECHLVMCLTKPRITYNEDILSEDKEECVICLEELKQGDTIARLPCLCIYHKSCIDQWFKINRSCPEHPDG